MVYLIGEIGINHDGSLGVAKKLIDTAVVAGVDAVKFQLFYPNEVSEVWDKIANCYLSLLSLLKVRDYCRKANINFLCSAFGIGSIEGLYRIGERVLKIPSGKIVDIEYLEFAKSRFDKFILSSGMSNLSEIDNALNILGKDKTTVLHCVSAYPTPIDEINMNAMVQIREQLECKVGLSDHTEGHIAPIIATVLGTEIIEKHFTLDKFASGPDHRMSLDPIELTSMVQAVRDTEKAMGDGKKKVEKSERVNLHRRN